MLALLVIISCTQAAQVCFNLPNPVSFRHGTLNGTIISDGPVDMGPEFFPTVPAQAILDSYSRNFIKLPRLFAQNVLILDTPTGRILIDPGSGNSNYPGFERGGQLPLGMKAANIDPASINYIFVSHGHWDHIAGAVDAEGERVFLNAKLFIDRREHEYWSAIPFVNRSPRLNDSIAVLLSEIYLTSIKPYMDAEDLFLLDRNARPLEGVRVISTPGHTAGHNSFEIEAGTAEPLLLSGDVWVSKGDQLQNPGWAWGADVDSDVAYASRMRIIRRAVSKKPLVFTYHEDFPGLGYVRVVGPTYDFLPARVENTGIGTQGICLEA